jgi:hypothetical protein
VRISHSCWEFLSLSLSLSLTHTHTHTHIFVENFSSLSHILPPEFSSHLFVENLFDQVGIWRTWEREGGGGGREVVIQDTHLGKEEDFKQVRSCPGRKVMMPHR